MRTLLKAANAHVLWATVQGAREFVCNTRHILRFSTMAVAGGEKITFSSTNAAGDGHGVLFGDPSKTPLGLIVIHEWWGMNEQIQREGADIAKAGNFTVVVPDFYRGKLADDRETAGHLMSGLDWPGALQDISGVAKFLVGKGCSKVGVTGFCMGGALSFAAAVKCPEISAAAPFYGIPSVQLADPATSKIPMQAHFGLKDEVVGFSSPAEFNPLKERLEKAGANFEFYTYDAGHGFTNPQNPNYNKEITDTALSRMYQFMHKHLKGGNL